MGDLTINKIMGSLIAVALVIMGLQTLSYALFPSPGGYGHGDHGEELTANEKLAQRYAFFIPVEEGAGGGEVVEEVFDLGLALANADISRGERSFRAKCSTCHTIDQGGANGTGPNLFASIGLQKAGHAGFNYSNVLSGMEGTWTYEAMDAWLYNPSAYARGTSMAFAGLRRDDERANVIAYLASYTPNAAPFPDPLPAAGEDTAEDATDAELVEEGAEAEPAGDTTEGAVEGVVDETGDVTEALGEAVEETAETVEDAADAVEGVVEDAVEAAEDAVEEIVEDDGQ